MAARLDRRSPPVPEGWFCAASGWLVHSLRPSSWDETDGKDFCNGEVILISAATIAARSPLAFPLQRHVGHDGVRLPVSGPAVDAMAPIRAAGDQELCSRLQPRGDDGKSPTAG